MRLSLAEVHVRQSTAGSCVAACVCMVRRRRGEQVAESTILEAWGSAGPFALRLHAEEVRDRNYPMIIDAVSRSSRGLLRAVLRDGRWVIITIVLLPHPGRLHAVVLIEITDDDSFLYLDPDEPLQAQPLAFSEDELVQQWSGEPIVCAPFP
jgi:ABC-type bacteriocin/lantibiotic exporter with double-glycine peptidase domain